MNKNKSKRPNRPEWRRGYESVLSENNYLIFYADIVNHRNLEPKEFFEYLDDKYGRYDHILTRIKRMAYQVSSYKADKIKLIIDYKRAQLRDNQGKLKELDDKFNRIQSVELVGRYTEASKNSIKQFSEIVPNTGNKMERDIRSRLEKYLNDNSLSYEESVELMSELKQKFKLIEDDREKYIDFIRKYCNVSFIYEEEINQLIEVVSYFLKNLKSNLWEIELYSYIINSRKGDIKKYNVDINKYEKLINNHKAKSEEKIELFGQVIKEIEDKRNQLEVTIKLYEERIRSIYVDNEEDLSPITINNINKLCAWKIKKIENGIKVYEKVLNYLLEFKEKINTKGLEKIKISMPFPEEDYISEMIIKIRNFVSGYSKIKGTMISDSKQEKLKEIYFDKTYKMENK